MGSVGGFVFAEGALARGTRPSAPDRPPPTIRALTAFQPARISPSPAPTCTRLAGSLDVLTVDQTLHSPSPLLNASGPSPHAPLARFAGGSAGCMRNPRARARAALAVLPRRAVQARRPGTRSESPAPVSRPRQPLLMSDPERVALETLGALRTLRSRTCEPTTRHFATACPAPCFPGSARSDARSSSVKYAQCQSKVSMKG